MKHRHLSYPARTPAARLPSAALVDILDRGDLDAWRPIAVAIRRQPLGPFTERVARLVDEYPMYGTSPLWRAWIERCRTRSEGEAVSGPPLALASLRQRRGLTQSKVAARAGMTQSDLSKLERRSDLRLSTLRAYAVALGGRITTTFTADAERIELRVGGSDGGRARPARSRNSPKLP